MKTSYDTDGRKTTNSTVDPELSVNAWGTSDYAVSGSTLQFGVCIQAGSCKVQILSIVIGGVGAIVAVML